MSDINQLVIDNLFEANMGKIAKGVGIGAGIAGAAKVGSKLVGHHYRTKAVEQFGEGNSLGASNSERADHLRKIQPSHLIKQAYQKVSGNE